MRSPAGPAPPSPLRPPSPRRRAGSGTGPRRPCRRSFSKAVSTSLRTHSLATECAERTSEQNDHGSGCCPRCRRGVPPSIFRCSRSNQQRMPWAWRSAYRRLGERLVCGAVADDARAALNRGHGADQRWQIGDPGVRHAAPSKECRGVIPFERMSVSMLRWLGPR